MGTSRSDIPIDTPLGKTVAQIRRLVRAPTVYNLHPSKWQTTILALCDALERREVPGVDDEGRCNRCGCRVVVEKGEDGIWSTTLTQELREARQENERLRALVRRAAEDSCVTTSDDPGCFYCDHGDHTDDCPTNGLLRSGGGEGEA